VSEAERDRFSKKLNANGKYFCSELAHEVLLSVGVRIAPSNRAWRITPTELYLAARAFVAGAEYDRLCLC
jgi:hypothetical protein